VATQGSHGAFFEGAAHGLTRTALERACGLSRGVVANVERDEHTPRAATVVRLVRVLGPGLHVHVTPRG
jgi:transcriptional regulator with XRE-family HTH domain